MVLRYEHTEQDRIDDIKTYQSFKEKFEHLIKELGLDIKLFSEGDVVSDHGKSGMYAGSFDSKEFRDKSKNRVQPSNIICFISSDIWGIINDDDDPTTLNERHYYIDTFVEASVTFYRCKNTYTRELFKFYTYNKDIDRVLSELRNHLINEVLPFIKENNLKLQ